MELGKKKKIIFLIAFVFIAFFFSDQAINNDFFIDCKYNLNDSAIKLVGFYSDYSEHDKDLLQNQLSLDKTFLIERIFMENLSDLSFDYEDYDVIIIAGGDFSTEILDRLQNFVSNGGSLIIFPNRDSQYYEKILKKLNILESGGSAQLSTQSTIIDTVKPIDPLIDDISWSSSPEIKVYQILTNLDSSVKTLITKFKSDIPIMLSKDLGSGSVIAINALYTKQDNWDLQVWWYSPYLLYRLTMILTGQTPQNFKNWSYSPIPQSNHRVIFIFGNILLIVSGFLFYVYAKNKSKKPIEISKYIHLQDHKNNRKNTNKTNEVSNKTDTKDLNDNNKEESESNVDDWEKIGMHRQISSFFFKLFTYLLINLPYQFLIIGIYYRYIQPFPITQGALSWIGSLLNSIFLILDFEIGSASKKFIAEYRIKSIEKALKYAQIYVWWHFYLSIIQGIVIISLCLFYLPDTYLGYLSFFLIFNSLTRIPGFFGTMGLVIDSFQRFDINIKLEAILSMIINNIISYSVILICRNYFGQLPQYGEAFGAGIGIYLGGYINTLLNFIVYLVIFRRFGFHMRDLIRKDFDNQNLKEELKFGFNLTVGNSWGGIAGTIEMALISVFVLSYSSELGLTGVVGTLTGILGILSTFLAALMPAISEAHGNQKLKLTEYYLVEGIKWINFFLFFVMAVWSAVGERFILLTGAQYSGAIKYIPIQLFFAFFWPMAWYADTVFQGTNHTGYNTLVWIIEQGIRVVLLMIFLPRFQIWGMFYAYIPGIIAKDIISLVIIRRKICKFKPYWMHTTVISALSSIIIFLTIKALAFFIPEEFIGLNIILIIIGFLGGLILHGFLTGLFGGWDFNTLEEFKRGISLVNSTKKSFAIVFRATKFGHGLSHWKEKFNVDIFSQAALEAQLLNNEKGENIKKN